MNSQGIKPRSVEKRAAVEALMAPQTDSDCSLPDKQKILKIKKKQVILDNDTFIIFSIHMIYEKEKIRP